MNRAERYDRFPGPGDAADSGCARAGDRLLGGSGILDKREGVGEVFSTRPDTDLFDKGVARSNNLHRCRRPHRASLGRVALWSKATWT